MLEDVRSIVAVLARRFRRRVVLELENLALRHQLHVLRRQRPSRPIVYNRPTALGLALPIMAALPGHDGVGQASYRRPMGTVRVPPVLALALEIRTAVSGLRDS
jgi:hypothetical protein